MLPSVGYIVVGSADLKCVLAVAETIAIHKQPEKTIVDKSTVHLWVSVTRSVMR